MATLSELYTMEEAAQHNTNEDCWVVIDGKVYDVSTYLNEHPGGDDVLLSATGKDATDEFEDAGHTTSARELMENFCIGEIDQSSQAIPRLQIFSKERASDLPKKIGELSKQYWVVPVSVVGLSLVVGYLCLRKK